MDLESIILNELIQTQKENLHINITTTVWDSYSGIQYGILLYVNNVSAWLLAYLPELGRLAHVVKCLLGKREDLNSDSQDPPRVLARVA